MKRKDLLADETATRAMTKIIGECIMNRGGSLAAHQRV